MVYFWLIQCKRYQILNAQKNIWWTNFPKDFFNNGSLLRTTWATPPIWSGSTGNKSSWVKAQNRSGFFSGYCGELAAVGLGGKTVLLVKWDLKRLDKKLLNQYVISCCSRSHYSISWGRHLQGISLKTFLSQFSKLVVVLGKPQGYIRAGSDMIETRKEIKTLMENIFKDFHKVLFCDRIYSSNWRSGIISH